MPLRLTFKKNGEEIKAAIENRMAQLRSRLEKRNQDLDAFMEDRQRLRSYLIRSSEPAWLGHTRSEQAALLYSKDDISSEEDEQEFDLPYEDLVAYGFESEMRVD